MKYLVTAPDTHRVLQRRLFHKDPRTIEIMSSRVNATVHDIEDADADAIGVRLDSIEPGGHATYEGGALTLHSTLDAIAGQPFKSQLQAVLRTVRPPDRQEFISLIGAAFALDDVDAMLVALDDYNDAGRPGNVQSLKASLVVVVGREITKRAL